jgi:hypothetical protein
MLHETNKMIFSQNIFDTENYYFSAENPSTDVDFYAVIMPQGPNSKSEKQHKPFWSWL